MLQNITTATSRSPSKMIPVHTYIHTCLCIQSNVDDNDNV